MHGTLPLWSNLPKAVKLGLIRAAIRDGKSAYRAAAEIPGATGSALIGMAHRNDLRFDSDSVHNTKAPRRITRARGRTNSPPHKTGRKRARRRGLLAGLNVEPANGGKGVSLVDRRMQGSRRECAWVLPERGPDGEPMCCGASAGHDRYLSFCEAHERIAVGKTSSQTPCS